MATNVGRTPARHRFVVSPLAVISGLVGGAAVVVLLGQFGVLFPTVVGLVVGAVAGVLVGLAVVNVTRAVAVNRANRAGGVAAPVPAPAVVAPAAPAPTAMAPASAVPAAAGPTARWLRVPATGLAAYATPDASVAPVAHLDPFLPVSVQQHWGDWAHITCENGWTAWVDGRELQEVSP